MAHTLFVSDLHLPAEASPLRDAFARFLAGPARQAQAVYILGDLFEVWIGDAEGLREYTVERSSLRGLVAAGVPVFFQHGNRDFLVGQDFAQATGVQLLPDPFRLTLAGVPTLLSHGDLFCTDDVGYQRWRRFSRNGASQAVFRSLPAGLRDRIAGGVRARSGEQKALKSSAIMDVNEGAIAEAFAHHGVQRIIHGHTHRPGDHRYERPDGVRLRHVLADWHPGRCEALRVGDAGSVDRVLLA